jgi:hypothetical protein
MKRLIVQVCAIVLCTGMFTPALFGLSLDQDAAYREIQKKGLRTPVPVLHASTVPARDADMFAAAGGGDVDAFREKASAYLFGKGSPEGRNISCSIDPSTMCIVLDTDQFSRVFPVVPGSGGSILEVLSRPRDVDPGNSLYGTMILAGVGLIALSGLWARKRPSPVQDGTPMPHRPAHPPLPEGLEGKSEARPQSIAA